MIEHRALSRTALIENGAPCGSASTAIRLMDVSKGAASTRPPSSAALAAVASTSLSHRFTPQPAAPSPGTADMVATTSRETGCWGSPPT